MQKYFISKEEFNNDKITSDDVFHIRQVMRSKIGDKILISNDEVEYICVITQIEKNYILFYKQEMVANENELPFLVDIYQGFPKSDKLEDIIKHSTELGVNNIYAVITKRSIFKLDQSKKESKIIRYNKICKEASEQSNRKVCSKFIDILKIDKIDFSSYNKLILCYEESAKNNELSNFKSLLKDIKKDDKVCIFIGPEGGIDKDEVDCLINKGFTCCGLGPRILRTETASLYVMSCLSYEKELM
ncbi:MAG: RsmE family RNA methyltransferase [Anaeroplasmataceae bacterium]